MSTVDRDMARSLRSADTVTIAPSRPNYRDLRAVLRGATEAQHAQLVEARNTVDQLAGELDSDSLLERELAERAAGRALEVIADVEHALLRMDDGTYGVCERCGGPIAAARLEAIPYTRYCV